MKMQNKQTLFFALMTMTAIVVGCEKNAATKSETTAPETSQATQQQATNPTATTQTNPVGGDVQKLVIEDLSVGNGTEAVKGKSVSVHYSGKLTNGTEFDSSIKRGTPFEFRLGEGMVIKGWEEGVVGMKVGGKRKLTIPPDMAYGPRGAGNGLIPPNATLVFEIELKAVN